MMDMLHARLGARGLNALSHDYDTPTCPPVPSVYSNKLQTQKINPVGMAMGMAHPPLPKIHLFTHDHAHKQKTQNQTRAECVSTL